MTDPRQLELEYAPSLPPYRLRRSSRARHLRATITPQQGLVVVLPPRVARAAVEPFLLAHREWLERELAHASRHATARERGRLPRCIRLAALEREVVVDYLATASGGVRVSERDGRLAVRGEVRAPALVSAGLRRWLARTARAALGERLGLLAGRHALPFSRCSIRGQQGRWGSCSSDGHVSLNYKLLFLTPVLVDYVLVHELTHTLHPDHSPRFWRRLEQALPGARDLHARLAEAGALVPWWAEV